MNFHPDDIGMWGDYYDAQREREEGDRIATMDDAHREWHRNTGVPLGQPGCPQDACHPPDDEYDEPEPLTDEMLQNWREANEYTDEAPDNEEEMPF